MVRRLRQGVHEDGTSYFTLLDCWHSPDGYISGIERCYDLFDADFSSPDEASQIDDKVNQTVMP